MKRWCFESMRRLPLVLAFWIVESCGLAVDLRVESTTIRPGQTFAVSVSLENAQEVGFLTFDLAYPSSELRLVKWTAGEFLVASPPGTNGLANLHEAFQDALRQDGYESLRLAWVQSRGYTGSAKILDATFQLATNTVSSNIILSLSGLQAVRADAALTEIPATGWNGLLTVLLAPGPGISVVFKRIEFLKFGELSLTVQGPPGQSLVLEGSPDLKTWASQSTIVLASDGQATFSDTQTALARMRFYRIRSAAR
jgi:hypothetical protein